MIIVLYRKRRQGFLVDSDEFVLAYFALQLEANNVKLFKHYNIVNKENITN
jgi:hypothetical protein